MNGTAKEIRGVIRAKDMSKFNDKDEAYTYCKGKPKDHFKGKIDNTSDTTLDESFLTWRDVKKRMFSPAEYTAIGLDGDTKDAIVSSFVDWAEDSPRRIAVIILTEDELPGCTAQAEKVDVIGGANAFTVELSESGEEPVEYYMSNWGCSQREYEFFEEIEGEGDWDLYDGEVTPWQDVLTTLGLQVIES